MITIMLAYANCIYELRKEIAVMLLSFVYGLIGIVLLTAFCLIGAFSVPQIAYWMMTPYAVRLLEKAGIPRKLDTQSWIKIGVLTVLVGMGFVLTIITAGIQGVRADMSFFELSLRFVIFFWMVSLFDAIVLDWWMFTKTDIFGVLIKKKTGETPEVWRVDPQWDGKEMLKLIIEIVVSVILAFVFIKIV